jgi:hypothetical protein
MAKPDRQRAPDLPSWMRVDPDGIQPHELGGANADQYTVGGWGTTGSQGQSRWAEDGYWANSGNLPNRGTDEGQIASENPLSAAALSAALSPGTSHKGPIAPSQPSTTMINGEGIAGYGAPPTAKDRFKRSLGGAFRGVDTGSTLGNVGVNAASALVPGAGLANRVAGAVQGARDNRPVFTPTGGGGNQPSTLGSAPSRGVTESVSNAVTGMGGGGYYSMVRPQTEEEPPATSYGAPAPGTPWGPETALAPPPGEGAPPGEGEESASEDALAAVLAGGQQYATDGAGGRRGVAGSGGGYEFAGFDFAQDPSNRDIGKSAKYAFSHLAGQAAAQGVPQPRTKAEAEAWFSQYIAPGMNQLGFTVHKVQGDKAFISAPEHPEGAWVDFVIGADGSGATPLAWQAELGGAGAEADPEALFAVLGGGGGPSGMARGEDGTGGLLDSGNTSLDSFASRLVQQLLEGAALEDTLEMDRKRSKGLTPESLRAVGF